MLVPGEDGALRGAGGGLMLEMKPACERCGAALPPDSREARICSYECTFCADCADEMNETCPNCGGELVLRPIREPKQTA